MTTSRSILGAAAGAAALLFSAMPAMAVSVVDAKRVEITSVFPTWIQLAEIEAYEFGSLINVAASANGGVATATGFDYGGHPDGAIDGVVPAGYVGPDVFHSDSPNAGETLTITFASATDLTSLKVFGVMDGGAARNFFNYAIYNAGNVLLASGLLDSRVNPFDTVTFDDPPATGAIPEPSTWAMMILGFGAAGAAMRSRRRVAALS